MASEALASAGASSFQKTINFALCGFERYAPRAITFPFGATGSAPIRMARLH
jgi:hypothetical protein